MFIRIESKKSVMERFIDEMNSYRSFVLGFDVSDDLASKHFYQAQGVMLTYCELYPKYEEEIYDIWVQDYYSAMTQRVGEL
jgi:hypothetical protein